MEKEFIVYLYWGEAMFDYKATSTTEKEAIEKVIQEATLIDGWLFGKEGSKTTLYRKDYITKIVCVDREEEEEERKKSAQKLRERMTR